MLAGKNQRTQPGFSGQITCDPVSRREREIRGTAKKGQSAGQQKQEGTGATSHEKVRSGYACRVEDKSRGNSTGEAQQESRMSTLTKPSPVSQVQRTCAIAEDFETAPTLRTHHSRRDESTEKENQRKGR